MTAKELLTEHKLEGSYWGLKIIEWEDSDIVTKDVLSKALRWQTCACGKQDARIPRWTPGDGYMGLGAVCAPKDPLLGSLGCRFGELFEQGYAMEHEGNPSYKAAECLIAIEQRAAEILKELVPA